MSYCRKGGHWGCSEMVADVATRGWLYLGIAALTVSLLAGAGVAATKPKPNSAHPAPSRQAPAPAPAPPSGASITTEARHAIIIETETGTVLLDKCADERMPPASMSKMMTAYVVFGLLKEGRAQTDGRIAGQRGGLEARRIEDVRAGRRPHHDRRSAPGHDRAVGQRCLRRAGRRAGRQPVRLCRPDEREGQGDRAQRQPFRRCRRAARPEPLDDRPRSRDIGPADDRGLSGILSLLFRKRISTSTI